MILILGFVVMWLIFGVLGTIIISHIPFVKMTRREALKCGFLVWVYIFIYLLITIPSSTIDFFGNVCSGEWWQKPFLQDKEK
jgi:hypothetical protein